MLPIMREIILREDARNKNLGFIRRRLSLRAENNPFDLQDERFVELFRLNKGLVRQLIALVRPRIVDRFSTKGVSLECKVFCALRFYAVGSYQRGIGQDFNLGLSQTTTHRCIHAVTEAIVILAENYIKFPTSLQERNALKYEFMHNWGFPGAIGAIDCFHVAIMKPKIDEHNFINRKGYHSVNVQIICDNKLKIRGLYANFGGSTHDSFIWRVSNAQMLLRDSGYPLQPYLLTPFRNPQNDAEQRYNDAHARARNCVKRTIGLLKMRFRCILKERTGRYTPEFMCLVIKACAVLHNMCIDTHIPFDEIFLNGNDNIVVDRHEPAGEEGVRARTNIVNHYFL